MNKKSFISFFKRGFHTSKPLKDMDLNPLPKLGEYASEKHIQPLVPFMWFLLLVGIPAVSIKMWYDEYQHRVVHPKRIKAPKHDFLHHQPRPYTWGDGDKSPLFHPYWNFTKNGYITDKEGNLLPKGTYVDE